MTETTELIHETVATTTPVQRLTSWTTRRRVAVGITDSCGWATGAVARPTERIAALDSEIERTEISNAAVLASMVAGSTAVADLREGERGLDWVSGGGIDVLLSARGLGELAVRSGWT